MTEASDGEATSALLDGRYRLGECIGQGGMARVFRAEDTILGRTVAVKIMRTEAEHPSIPPRAHTEMSLLAGVNHPSLVTLFDAKVVPGQPEYLVMEFVEGPSLAAALQDGPLDAAEVAAIGAELAAGLDVVHRAGIVHRDVKPSNVLLAPSPRPGRRYWAKLADFGVAYLADSTRHTSPGTVIGTAAYLAPEQVRGAPAGPPADVYALGLLLLETVTGARAFPEASGIGRVMARLVDDPEIPAWLGPEWSGLIRSMIARDPAERPTAREVEDRLLLLPTDIVRPMGADRSAMVDVATQPIVVAPSARPAAAERTTTPDLATEVHQVPRTRDRARRRRSRRTRVWMMSGAAAAVVAVLVIGGYLWAGGLTGGFPSRDLTPVTGPTSPAPAETLVDDSADTAVITVDDDAPGEPEPAPVPASDTTDVEQRPASTSDDADAKAAAKAAKDAAKAQEKSAKDAAKAEQQASQKPGSSRGTENRSENGSKNSAGNKGNGNGG